MKMLLWNMEQWSTMELIVAELTLTWLTKHSITCIHVAVGSCDSVVRAPAAKAGGPGFDSRWLPWVFLFQLAYTNADGMKDLWCSSIVGCYQHRCEWKGLSGRVCGALAQFGCYQHRHEWMLGPHPYQAKPWTNVMCPYTYTYTCDDSMQKVSRYIISQHPNLYQPSTEKSPV